MYTCKSYHLLPVLVCSISASFSSLIAAKYQISSKRCTSSSESRDQKYIYKDLPRTKITNLFTRSYYSPPLQILEFEGFPTYRFAVMASRALALFTFSNSWRDAICLVPLRCCSITKALEHEELHSSHRNGLLVFSPLFFI